MRSDQEHLDLFRVYVDQIGQHPLLTKEDEIELSQAYQAGLDALRELADSAADDLAQAVTSLETPVGEDGAVLGDFLEDDSAAGPDELVVEAVGREALEQVLRALPERGRQVLILRFGLDSGTPRTLEEIGAVMGFSRERAPQVERDALAALRRPEVRAGLPDLDGGRLRRPRARGQGRTGSWTGSGRAAGRRCRRRPSFRSRVRTSPAMVIDSEAKNDDPSITAATAPSRRSGCQWNRTPSSDAMTSTTTT
jgi:Sigma-70, region 4/Sigma-70 factor, region 1.2